MDRGDALIAAVQGKTAMRVLGGFSVVASGKNTAFMCLETSRATLVPKRSHRRDIRELEALAQANFEQQMELPSIIWTVLWARFEMNLALNDLRSIAVTNEDGITLQGVCRQRRSGGSREFVLVFNEHRARGPKSDLLPYWRLSLGSNTRDGIFSVTKMNAVESDGLIWSTNDEVSRIIDERGGKELRERDDRSQLISTFLADHGAKPWPPAYVEFTGIIDSLLRVSHRR